MTTTAAHRTIEAVWRIEFPRLVAGLARMVRDVGTAEELAQDALVAALEQWPETGVPDNPGAWLMAIAKRRAIDLIRRKGRYRRKLAELGSDLAREGEGIDLPDVDALLQDHIEDDLLRLMFVSCHPALSTDARVALTLRLLGGQARTPEETDWMRIADLYDVLARSEPSPMEELNRAVALGMAFGPAAGLEHVDRLRGDPSLARYHLLPSVRGDLLAKLGRLDEARNERERALLLERAAPSAE